MFSGLACEALVPKLKEAVFLVVRIAPQAGPLNKEFCVREPTASVTIMSQLRKQLQDLQNLYAAGRYPGDLADKLLGETAAMGSRWRIGSPRLRLTLAWAGGAIAASISLAVLLYEPAADAVQNSVQKITQTAGELSRLGRSTPAASSPVEYFSIIPEFRTLDIPVPPTPAAPAMDRETAQESA